MCETEPAVEFHLIGFSVLSLVLLYNGNSLGPKVLVLSGNRYHVLQHRKVTPDPWSSIVLKKVDLMSVVRVCFQRIDNPPCSPDRKFHNTSLY